MIIDGYQQINFKNVAIDDELGATIPGIYEAVDGAVQATMVLGLNDDGTAIKPFYTVFTKDGSDYLVAEIVGYNKTITITDADKVTIAAIE